MARPLHDFFERHRIPLHGHFSDAIRESLALGIRKKHFTPDVLRSTLTQYQTLRRRLKSRGVKDPSVVLRPITHFSPGSDPRGTLQRIAKAVADMHASEYGLPTSGTSARSKPSAPVKPKVTPVITKPGVPVKKTASAPVKKAAAPVVPESVPLPKPIPSKPGVANAVLNKVTAAGISVALPFLLYLGPHYAPRVPQDWKPVLRENASVATDLFYPNLPKKVRNRMIDEALYITRKYSLWDHVFKMKYDGYTTETSGTSAPAFLNENSIRLKNRDAFLHEWGHRYGYVQSKNTLELADALSEYTAHARGTSFQLPFAGITFGGKKPGESQNCKIYSHEGGIRVEYDHPEHNVHVIDGVDGAQLDGIHRAFQGERDDEGHRQGRVTPGNHLGKLAWLLEHHVTKRPGDGLIVIREVSRGRNAVEVINEILAGKHDADRKRMVDRNKKFFFGNPPKKSPVGMQRRRQQKAAEALRCEKAKAANRKVLLSRR
ncbi:hypothetical protein HYV43_04720 [Candidatus Micrarchaeota archaeon]|nr:hypothetical protein [Candidatus Micrarchaeota archaeon]